MDDVTINIRGEKFPPRLPTKDENIEAWSKLAFDLNFHRSISLRSLEVSKILDGIDEWVESQKTVHQETEADYEERVGRAFWSYIARCDVPRSTRGRPKKNVDE